MSRRHLRRGFTLVELVVVVADIALLASILIPLVGRTIDDAKIARAQNECVVIASAIQTFYRDLGMFPAAYAGSATLTPNNAYSLVSGTAIDSDVPSGTAVQYGFTANGNDDWYDGGAGHNRYVDVFDNHLNQNAPKGGLAFYQTKGEFKWNGPYAPTIGMDPWGHPYMCNIRAAYRGSGAMCIVMSAGPNGYIDTAYTAGKYGLSSTTNSLTGDDIWSVVAIVQ